MDHAAGMLVIDGVPDVEEAVGQLALLQVPAGDGAARPLTRPSGTLSPGGEGESRWCC
jgi:hypothetical protein